MITNPDGLGDLILRQPLFEALRHAGYELLLVVREEHRPIAEQLVPWAQLLFLRENPYEYSTAESYPDRTAIWNVIDAFGPELCVAAPFQRTSFDELVLSRYPETRRVCFDGPYFTPPGQRWQSSLASMDNVEQVDTRDIEHEFLRLPSLIQTILGRPVTLLSPRFIAAEHQLQCGREFLSARGIPEGGYYYVCIADNKGSQREWLDERWVEVLRHVVVALRRHVVISGLPSESAHLQGIAEQVSQTHCHVATDQASGLDLIAGLVSFSFAFLGRDSGPMHLAAAAGRPVIALFGGGHWPRFTPVGTRSASLMMGVPCLKCGWECPFAQTHCIKGIKVDEVLQALADCERGSLQFGETRITWPDYSLLAQMVVEAAARPGR